MASSSPKAAARCERRFAAGADVAHEAAGFHSVFCGAVGIGSVGEQHAHDTVVRDALGGAEGGVQRRLAGAGIGVIGVGTLLHAGTERDASGRGSRRR